MLRRHLGESWAGRILAEHDTEPTELFGGGLKLALGAWLLLPLHTFAISPSFEPMEILPEWAWGLTFVAIGLFHLAVLRDGCRPRRRRACLIGFVVWFAMATLFLWAQPAGLGGVLFYGSAVAQGWAYIRLGRPS